MIQIKLDGQLDPVDLTMDFIPAIQTMQAALGNGVPFFTAQTPGGGNFACLILRITSITEAEAE